MCVMKVLGIDPGYGRCGVAIVERLNGKDALVYSDCIETSPRDEFAERLAAVTDACIRLMEEYAPDSVAMEKLYFSANQKTAMRVAEVRGALLQAAAARDLRIFEYGPGEVKSATAGFGRADKAQIARIIRILLKIEKDIKHDDEYDAIAIGITHLATMKN